MNGRGFLLAEGLPKELAFLWAAAPDLLEACKVVLNRKGDGNVPRLKMETVRLIKAAIAKAEGRGLEQQVIDNATRILKTGKAPS